MSLPPPSSRDLERVERIASDWVVLEADRALTIDEERELSAWLAADPRHRQSYQALRRTWSDISELAPLADLVQLAPVAKRPLIGSRRAGVFAGALASAAAAMLALVYGPGQLSKPAAHYETRIAETRQVTLPDGSSVTLGARSQLHVEFAGDSRRVKLTGGEAFFDVVCDEARPFLVEAGPSRVRVMGTKFEVSHGAGSVRVAVLEGLVRVSDTRMARAGGTPEKLLRAHQRTEILLAAAPKGPNGAAFDRPAPASAAGAWREGRLVYENARLADLVADVNRYYAPGARILDPGAREQRLTASFKTSEIPAFMSAVGAAVPVRVEEGRDGSFNLSSTAD